MNTIDDWFVRASVHSQMYLESLSDRRESLAGRDERDTEEGSTTVEYAIGAVATAGFAGLLLAVLKSGGVKGLLTTIITSALSL